jgi:hypothetical protein
MANPAGESNDEALRLDFDRRLMLQFRGSVVTSDAAKVVSHGRYVAFQMAEVSIPRNLFAEILRLIAELRPSPIASTA